MRLMNLASGDSVVAIARNAESLAEVGAEADPEAGPDAAAVAGRTIRTARTIRAARRRKLIRGLLLRGPRGWFRTAG